MASGICNHGQLQQLKYGLEQRDGMEFCRGCGLPTAESYRPPPTPRAQTPQDRARLARASGARFFEIQLEVAESTRDVSIVSGDSGQRTERDHAGVLAGIEAEGWRLEHVGYVFVATGQSTRAKMLGTGEQVAVSGITMGIYLFLATDQTIGTVGP